MLATGTPSNLKELDIFTIENVNFISKALLSDLFVRAKHNFFFFMEG